MRLWIGVILLSFFIKSLYSQTRRSKNSNEFKIYNYTSCRNEKPLFPGGYLHFLELLRKHTCYTQSIADTLVENIRVIARVTLDSTGKIIKREAWSKYEFFQNDILHFLDSLPDFETPARIENCLYEIHLGFLYKAYNLVPDWFSDDLKIYSNELMHSEKLHFPGGYAHFLELLRKYTHYPKVLADSLSAPVHVIARITLDSTGRVIKQYAWSENQYLRNSILYFLESLPDFELSSQIEPSCYDIRFDFLFKKYHEYFPTTLDIICVYPSESKEFEKYINRLRIFLPIIQ
ncbi:hypothetical protein [Odoribacter lunatus]|uniref:hypothetical protein n=1 Tax=Odoribacter lunatus TaxID=2941335 RepID=UPI00203F53E0|nr:hypothetical protein [Odoribacter lunatus]